MITTNIGKITLTENQILNYEPSGVFTGFSYVDEDVTAMSEVTPSQQDIDNFKSVLNGLPDTIPQKIAVNQFQFKRLWGYVFSQLSSQATYALCGFEQPIESLFYYPNIGGIKPFIQGLVGTTLPPGNYVVTQQDVDIIINGFLEQGVVL